MSTLRRRFSHSIALILLLACAPACFAGRVRYHYVPIDAAGNTTIRIGNGGAPGERVSRFWFSTEPYGTQPRPTHLARFRHTFSGRQITLPLTLPEGTPRIERRSNRIIYNYGSDVVEVHFLPDGSADVIYDSGLFRRPWGS
jgi:hypothetical protein